MELVKKYTYGKLLRRAQLSGRRVKLPDLESVRKVGVLWEPGEKEAYQFLHDHFARGQVIFRNLCVYSENPIAATGTNAITPKELNWMGFPKPDYVKDFLNTEFDLLLNIALKQTFLFEYLTALSKARFKTGWSPKKNNYFDLNINIKGKQDALYLARQQIFYIRQLNKTL